VNAAVAAAVDFPKNDLLDCSVVFSMLFLASHHAEGTGAMLAG